MPVLTPELKQRWDTDGWCIVPEVIPSDELAAAQEAVHHHFPTPGEMADRGSSGSGEWHTWDAPWPEFPFHSSRLNALVLHDHVVDLAEGLLETRDLALYMGIVTAKYAHQASGYNQLLHTDYPNHMLVVPRHAPGYQQVEFFVYLTDVTAEDGATRFVSWQKTKDIPVEMHTLNYVEHAELYADPAIAAAPAGSVVAYRPTCTTGQRTSPTPAATGSCSMCPSATARRAGAAIKRGLSAASPPSSPSTSNRPHPVNWRSWEYPSPAIRTGTRRRWPASKRVTRASTCVRGGTRRADHVGMRTSELTTPALLVEAGRLEDNLRIMADALPGERLRPHVKAHKCTGLASRQAEAGHTAFTCATVREMEGMVRAGLAEDLLLANEVVDATRLGALARAGARITVAVDSDVTIDAAARAGVPEVLIDVNVGLPRCGCPPGQAGPLADRARSAGLSVRGVMGYEGHIVGLEDRASRAAMLEESMGQLILAADDVGGDVISAGGTGTYDLNSWATEIQAGSYALMDTAYGKLGPPVRPGVDDPVHRDLRLAGLGRGRLRPQGAGHGSRQPLRRGGRGVVLLRRAPDLCPRFPPASR